MDDAPWVQVRRCSCPVAIRSRSWVQVAVPVLRLIVTPVGRPAAVQVYGVCPGGAPAAVAVNGWMSVPAWSPVRSVTGDVIRTSLLPRKLATFQTNVTEALAPVTLSVTVTV